MDGVETKFIEVRDEGTTIVCLVTSINRRQMHEAGYEQSEWMAYRGGWGVDTTGLYFSTVSPTAPVWAIGAVGSPAISHFSSGYLGSRTFRTAWEWIQMNWHHLDTGDLVDVSYILGESVFPKTSERATSTYYDHVWD